MAIAKTVNSLGNAQEYVVNYENIGGSNDEPWGVMRKIVSLFKE